MFGAAILKDDARDTTMDKEVKITLITTGFAISKSNPIMSKKDAEMQKFLTTLKDSEEELDMPSFMRRPIFGRQNQVIPPAAQFDKVNSPTRH